MPLTPAEQQDRYRACILGFAIGDALGFPLRGVPSASLLRLPSLAEDFAPRPRGRFAKGQFSDDTQLMLAAAESASLERRIDGRSAAAHIAWLWQEGVVLQPPPSLTQSAERLLAGTPWMSAGAPIGVKEPSALSRGLVVGLWHAGSPERLPHDAQVLSIVSHKDPTCAAAVAAFARAISLGASGHTLPAAAFCEQLAAAAAVSDAALAAELRYLPRALAWDLERALSQLRRIGVPAAMARESDGLPPHATPVLLTALYAALKVPHDFRQALSLVLRCGGEADVAAGVCGAVLGAHLGTEAIPARLRRNVLYADHLQQTADRLFEARSASGARAPALVRAQARLKP